MILAGDIGGTHTRLAVYPIDGKGRKPVSYKIFPSRNYSGLEEIILEWLGEKTGSIRAACFGIAGPVINGRVKTTNLPWVVDAKKIGRRFKIASVELLNDLQAMAYGAMELGEKEIAVINPGKADRLGNKAIIAAGTGLGEAVLFWNGREYQASASEGGHSDFAPRNSAEIGLLEYLLKRFTRVSYERVLSGPGLVSIYQFQREAEGKEPSWLAARLKKEDPPKVITELALAGTAECVRAVDMFVSLYGAEAGNLALKTLATGGIYIGGGIAPKILEKLRSGEFMKAFTDKGRYESLMGRIPVRVILNEEAGLIGAASFARHYVRKARIDVRGDKKEA